MIWPNVASILCDFHGSRTRNEGVVGETLGHRVCVLQVWWLVRIRGSLMLLLPYLNNVLFRLKFD